MNTKAHVYKSLHRNGFLNDFGKKGGINVSRKKKKKVAFFYEGFLG